jgi:hypothetical protein
MSRNKKLLLKAALLFVLVFLLAGCGGPPHCSAEWLINMINLANSNGPGLDTIDLAASCVYELDLVDNTIDGNNGLPSITSSIVINGNGATVRRGTGAQKAAIRLFHVSGGAELVLNNITLLDGMAMEPTNVSLLIENSGGAILNRGTLTVSNSLVTANRAKLKGGGIYNMGIMTINATTVQNNEVNIGNEPNEIGGGIYNTGTATITDSTISGNVASQSGGGIANNGNLTISNSTISGNSTTLAEIVSGAAIVNSGIAEISYTTIADNVGTTSGAVFSAPASITIYDSIVAYNSPSDCSYPATSMILGPNIGSDGSCGGMVTADPQLDPLANNGGPTMTHAIAATSPARDFAFGLHPAADQRGVTRPYGPIADVGSYEYNGSSSAADPSFLSGLVFDDSNADGMLQAGEPGLAGVELVLGTGPCLAPVSSVSAVTASDGTFQFAIAAPSAGTYCLSIDPLTPPNDTILIPGGFTVPIGGQMELTLSEGEDLVDLFFGWDYQFAGTDIQPKVVITDVTLSTTTPPDGGWVEVEVTVENTGAYPAEDYELVLIPHYGWGPPNPAGYVALPDLMPGVPHTEVFSPGVLYSPAGTYTLRVLVTDDWYALGDPDSTGTAGDYQDFPITVLETYNRCRYFENLDLSLVLLEYPVETLVLPVYVKMPGGVPGLGVEFPEDPDPWEYKAMLGSLEAYQCSLQGFEDRLYCLFKLTPSMPGTAPEFSLLVNTCPEPLLVVPHAQIPEPREAEVEVECKENMGRAACEEAGGKYVESATRSPYCQCP